MTTRNVHPVILEGTLGLRDAIRLSEELRDAIAQSSQVVISANGLTGIDISVVQLLVSAHKTALAAGRSLTLLRPAEGVLHEILSKTGFLSREGTPFTSESAFWTSTVEQSRSSGS